MIASVIILAVLIIIGLTSVGINAGYADKQIFLKLKIGLLKFGILPAKDKTGKEKNNKKAEGEKKPKAPKQKKKKKLAIGLREITELLKIVFKLLARFGKSICIDYFKLYYISASDDPYSAVMQFGYVNAALGALTPWAMKTFKVRESDIHTAVNMDAESMYIDAELEASIQIWEILYVLLCALAGLLVWFIKLKIKTRRKLAETGKETDHGKQ